MKTSAKKSITATQTSINRKESKPFFSKSGKESFFAPSRAAIQTKLTVGKPGDKFEQEADRMAEKVMRMPAPTATPSSVKDDKLQKADDDKLQKAEDDKLQKAEDDKLQKADDDKLQKADDDKLQKADDDKLQKADDDKLQKSEDDKLQKATEPDKDIQKKEDDKLQQKNDDKLQKADDDKLQRKENRQASAASDSVDSGIRNSTGGHALSDEVQSFMEPRFKADFSNVRIHSDQQAASLSTRLGARAFAHKNHIFFSRDQYQPGTSQGKQLLAHELTHTIQQGHAVQRTPQVSTTSSPPQVQGSAIGRILDWIADKARYIPGFTMFTVVLGVNPINMSSVDRSATNILRAVVELVPGGPLITQALENHGIIGKVATWIEGKIKTLGMVGSMFSNALNRFLDSLGWSDLAPWNWGSVWERAKSIFTAPISRLISFATNLVSEILGFIKDAILKPLAALAEGTRGYDLLKALLGQDPITGEAVPRTPDTLIGGFMKLIGQEEIWENIKKGNAIQRAWAWFQGTLAGLLGFARSIPQKIIQTLASLTITDLLTVVGAFRKIGSAFLGIAAEFGSWALGQVVTLLEILFSVVAPGVLPYLKKAKGAFVTILKNPIGFVGNLVRAAKLGFQRFAGNIVKHLKTALINWLVGPLAEAGVYIPKAFSLVEIVKLVLSVLGLTWQNIRAKLVKIIPEPVLAGLEKTAAILVTLVKEGPAAAWKQIKAELNELKGQLISQITQMVSVQIVKAAVIKLVSMLNPAGAVVQAIIAIYNTVTFFIEKARQIGAVVGAFINSIAAIAAGQVNAAASKVEQTLARTLTVVISFLAKFAGLGGIPKKLVAIVQKIRKPIDKALDKIVAWLGKILKKMVSAVAQAGLPKDPKERSRLGMQAAVSVVNRLPGKRVKEALIPPALRVIKTRYGFSKLYPQLLSGKWWVVGAMSPEVKQETQKTDDNAPNSAASSTLPDKVQILSSGGAVMVANYSRSARTGTLQSAIFSGAVTLNKLKHAPQQGQTVEQTVNAPNGEATVEYTISAANSLYGTPSAFVAVDRSDPDEAASYTATREAFPEVMHNWWQTEPTADAARISQLNSLGLVSINAGNQQLTHGMGKWHFMHTQLNATEKGMLNGPVNKVNMSALLKQLPAARRLTLGQSWKARWALGTQIHHIKPVNFGGGNANFIPLSAEKHVGGTGVHPRFWTPLKRFLMALR